MKIVHLLKTSAFLNGRSAVDLMDCALMSYCIWNSNELIEKLKENVENCIIDDGHDFFGAVEKIKTQIKDYDKFVEVSFFKKEPKKYQMKNGTSAYKIANPQEIKSYENCTPYFISPDYIHSGYNRKGAYFNDNEELIGDYDYFIYDDSFKIVNDTIIWKDGCSENDYSATIEIELVKSPQLYGYYKKGEPKWFKMNNEEKTSAYKIKEPKKIDSYRQIIPYYVSPYYEHHYYNRCKGAFFDEEKDLMEGYYYIQDGSFHINGDTISWIDGYRYRYKEQISAQIEMNPDIFIKGNDVELQKLKEKATNKHIEILRNSPLP